MPPRHPDTPVPPPEAFVVHSKRVACDGGGGALGHPLVYLEMGASDRAECGYCDRLFVLAGDGERENEYLNPGARGPEAH